jgi:hypothetical protein
VLDDSIPAFEPERSAETDTSGPEQDLPAWVAQAQQFRDQIQLAPDKPALDAIETSFLKVRVSLPDDAAADLDALIAKRRSALSEGAA